MAFPVSDALVIPTIFALGALGISGTLWALVRPQIALLFLLGSLCVGQLIRVPLLGQGGGLLLTDIASVVVIGAALVSLYRGHRSPSYVFPLVLSVVVLSSASVGLLIVFAFYHPLSITEFFIACFYGVRLSVSLLLLPAFGVLFMNRQVRARTMMLWYGTILILVTFGYIQWSFFSDFSSLVVRGWDPHQGRLTSTFLDPNFFGAFLLMGLFSVLVLVVQKPRSVPRLVAALCIIVALLLTKSRTSFVAGSVGGLFFSGFMLYQYLRQWSVSALVLWATLLVWVAGIACVGLLLLQERALNLVYTDPTIALRAEAFIDVKPALVDTRFLGVGYNAYPFYMRDMRLASSDFSLHSRAGSDNSFITVWVTLGFPGLLLFVGLGIGVVWLLMKQWRLQQSPTVIAAVASVVMLGIHAQFVNSLLYSHLLIPLCLLISFALSETDS